MPLLDIPLDVIHFLLSTLEALPTLPPPNVITFQAALKDVLGPAEHQLIEHHGSAGNATTLQLPTPSPTPALCPNKYITSSSATANPPLSTPEPTPEPPEEDFTIRLRLPRTSSTSDETPAPWQEKGILFQTPNYPGANLEPAAKPPLDISQVFTPTRPFRAASPSSVSSHSLSEADLPTLNNSTPPPEVNLPLLLAEMVRESSLALPISQPSAPFLEPTTHTPTTSPESSEPSDASEPSGTGSSSSNGLRRSARQNKRPAENENSANGPNDSRSSGGKRARLEGGGGSGGSGGGGGNHASNAPKAAKCPARGGNRARAPQPAPARGRYPGLRSAGPPAFNLGGAPYMPDHNDEGESEIDGDDVEDGPADEGEMLGSESDHIEAPENDDGDYSPSNVERCFRAGRRGRDTVRSQGKRVLKAKQVTRWCTTGIPPPLSGSASRLICTLATASNYMQQLTALIIALRDPCVAQAVDDMFSSSALGGQHTLQALANCCARLETRVEVTDFQLMVAQLQIAIRIDDIRRIRGEDIPINILANECGVKYTQLEKWHSIGSRLVYLVSAGTPYILLLFSVLGMRVSVCKTSVQADISNLAFYLRNPQDDASGTIIRNDIVPMLLLLRKLSPATLSLSFMEDESLQIFKEVAFSDSNELDRRLAEVDVNFFRLPARAPIWLEHNPTPLPPPRVNIIAEKITIKTPLVLKKTKCPTRGGDSKVWTENERRHASLAVEASDLDHLKALLCSLHAGGVTKPESYVKINSDICQGKTLHLMDANEKLLGFLITHLADFLPGWNKDMMARIHALFQNEWYMDNSDREDYEFLALHYSYYNRYAEKGQGAPVDIHPNLLSKEGKSRVNYGQRTPHESKDIRNDPEEHELLAEFLKDVLEFVNVNLKHHLPEEYEELKVYCDVLPFHDKSPAYPFGGFVVNICVATDGHRDGGDKILCVVIPFGDYSGGDLGVHEPGIRWDLKPGSVLIFPSCDLTHFNLHYKGLRGSIVLHSDKYGDDWVQTRNGWYICRNGRKEEHIF